jgi:hypothetical protein
MVLDLLCRVQLSRVSRRDEFWERVSKAVEARDYSFLCTADAPKSDAHDYFCYSQVFAFFKKREDIVIDGVDPRAEAWKTFCEAEAKCRETNEIFRKYSRGGFYFLPRVERILYIAQRKISTILGDLPPLSDMNLRFGPGATTQVKKKDASALNKLSQRFCCSEDLLRIVDSILGELPAWTQATPEYMPDCDLRIEDSRIDFVRKTCKTDRTIAVEPMLNSMVQLATGDHIASRLRKVGVDLRDQTLNQRLALRGSVQGDLATLDLSSASDTVSCGLVESLLPFDWWDFLRAQRSSYSLIEQNGEKERIRLEKFSTMGNGFTFALESLIFYALASACAEETVGTSQWGVSVYGDDIIVPVQAYSLLVEVLTACGFIVNEKKSFSSGPFRESCGKDYFSGTLVRPVFQKTALDAQSLFKLHNFFVRLYDFESTSIIIAFISEELAIYGPDGYGDGHLLEWDPFWVSRLGRRFVPVPHGRDRGWGGYTFETYTWRSRRAFRRLVGTYVYPQYSVYLSGGDEYPGNASFRRSIPDRSRHELFVRRISPHGSIRPDRQLSAYKGGLLQETLSGFEGYRRIKIYAL